MSRVNEVDRSTDIF